LGQKLKIDTASRIVILQSINNSEDKVITVTTFCIRFQ